MDLLAEEKRLSGEGDFDETESQKKMSVADFDALNFFSKSGLKSKAEELSVSSIKSQLQTQDQDS